MQHYFSESLVVLTFLIDSFDNISWKSQCPINGELCFEQAGGLIMWFLGATWCTTLVNSDLEWLHYNINRVLEWLHYNIHLGKDERGGDVRIGADRNKASFPDLHLLGWVSIPGVVVILTVLLSPELADFTIFLEVLGTVRQRPGKRFPEKRQKKNTWFPVRQRFHIGGRVAATANLNCVTQLLCYCMST